MRQGRQPRGAGARSPETGPGRRDIVSDSWNEAMVTEAPIPAEPARAQRLRLLSWLRRLGIAGFLFFLVKGLLWLAIPWLIARGIFS